MTHVRPYSPAVRLMRRTSNRLSDKVPERRSGHLPAGSGALNTTRIIVKRVFINFGTIFYMTIVLLQSFAWDCFEAKYYMSLQGHRTIIEFMHESLSNKVFHDRRTATEFIHESVSEENISWHLKVTVLTTLGNINDSRWSVFAGCGTDAPYINSFVRSAPRQSARSSINWASSESVMTSSLSAIALNKHNESPLLHRVGWPIAPWFDCHYHDCE